MSIHMSIHVSIRMSIHMSIRMSIHMSIRALEHRLLHIHDNGVAAAECVVNGKENRLFLAFLYRLTRDQIGLYLKIDPYRHAHRHV